MNSSLSLNSLSRDPDRQKPARKLPAWLVPLAIAAGFALLFLALFRDRLLPAPEVQVARVLATTLDGETTGESGKPAESGALLFQASGWIEPDPLPVKATALVDGVIESVHVLDGQRVAKGELLAELIAADARLALAVTQQQHRQFQSARAVHLASITTARKKLQAAQAQVDSAGTLRDEAADRMARLKELPAKAIPASEVVAAELRLLREDSLKLATEATREELASEVERLILETQVRDDQIAAAALAVDQAELALSRTRITAPVAGRIMRLHATPGQKKSLREDDPDSSTIAILYDPKRLQVRVDVPLADAAKLQIGQAVRILCSLLPDQTLQGEVTRITGEADLQRNTLQTKVRILDPADELRPEMLCRAEFLATAASGGAPTVAGGGSGTLATWLPRDAWREDGGVWVCDPDSKRVEKRAVTATSELRDGFIRIAEGLRPGEWVILSPGTFGEGQRVNPNLISQP